MPKFSDTNSEDQDQFGLEFHYLPYSFRNINYLVEHFCSESFVFEMICFCVCVCVYVCVCVCVIRSLHHLLTVHL